MGSYLLIVPKREILFWNSENNIIVYIITYGLHVFDFKNIGLDSAVGIATRYGLDGLGSNPGGGEIFRTRPDRPWGPPSHLYNGNQVFPGGKAAGAWR